MEFVISLSLSQTVHYFFSFPFTLSFTFGLLFINDWSIDGYTEQVFLTISELQTSFIKKCFFFQDLYVQEWGQNIRRISKGELISKIVHGWKLLITFAKLSLLDVWHGSEYVSILLWKTAKFWKIYVAQVVGCD